MPLPVVLISTLSLDGVRNAAPWSCVTTVLRPLDEILIASWLQRDTLENIRQTGEFVINVPPAGMEDAVMICAQNYPPEVDEFEETGLKARPSARVKPPGIEGCLAWAECEVEEEIAREKFVLIIAKVVHLEADTGSSQSSREWTMREQSRSAPWAGRMGCILSIPYSRERATSMHRC